MTRHYLGITTRGPTTFRNVLKHDTGEPLLLVNEGEATKLTLDYADWLDDGETISSVSVDDENCTATSSLSSPRITLTISASVSNTFGRITLLVTTSTGQIRREVIRIRRANRYTDEIKVRDYA